MPQIGWFEILVIAILAILIIGPKDFPIILKKAGGWIGSIKRYFNEIQKNVLEEDILFEDDNHSKEDMNKNKKKINKNE